MQFRFVQRYLSSKVLPLWTVLLIDVLIVVVSTFLAYAIRYDFRSIFLENSTLDRTVFTSLVVNLIYFRLFRTYSGVLRFSSFIDILRIFASLTAAFVTMLLIRVSAEALWGIRWSPISVTLMAYICSFALMATTRVIVKILFEVLNFDGSHSDNVFIYGAK